MGTLIRKNTGVSRGGGGGVGLWIIISADLINWEVFWFGWGGGGGGGDTKLQLVGVRKLNGWVLELNFPFQIINFKFLF